MFWLCSESYRGSGRLSRTWIDESDERPDKANECQGQGCYCQGNANAHIPYPFNGMGGFVEGGYETRKEAEQAEADLWDE